MCCCSLYSAAQSLKLNLGEQPVYTQDKVDVTYNDINLRFLKNSAILGASIYRNDTYFGDHFLNISSTKNIIKIEFEGKKSSVTTSTADLVVIKGDGNFELDQAGTSRWEGSAKEVRIAGASTSTAYTIVTVRIWLEGYVEGEETEDIDIVKRPGAEVHYYAQPNNLPSNGRPVTLAVVSDSKFQQTLQPYLLWKTQQGYHVEEIFADKVAQETGTSEDALAMAIRDKLMALQPQPSYVLLAGDKDQVPPFKPRTEMGGGAAAVTDYFYGEYTGDHYAEAAVGRFPANTSEQLKPMLDKTKYMSLIQPEEADWLRNSVVVHSPSMQPDGLSTQGACDYGVSFFKKWEGNSAEVIFRASKTTEINNKLKDGCSFVTYLGHGDKQMWFDDWSMPNYKVTDVQKLTNKDRYPVVLALTCLSGSFQYSSYYTCMAEQFLRMENAGAVVYVGATRESMDGADNLFFGGGSGAHQKFEHIGFLRSLFNPDKNDDESQLTRTIGDAVNIGKFASRVLNDNIFRRFSEFFTLFGDPTYQPYATVPLRMTIDAPATATAGHSVEVTTVPLAIVAISKEREVISVALADSLGKATLPIPADAPTGSCTLYSSAPNYNDLPSTISILPFDGQPEEASAVQKPIRVQYVDVVDMESVGSILQHELTSTQPASLLSRLLVTPWLLVAI
ncbi:MAG: hypothetical protein KBT12_01595 [Bacteroidales bacterium]|nr:hypothetical protein [Candidatus Physcousia equi]